MLKNIILLYRNMNIYECIIVFLILLYLIFWFKNKYKKEGFNNENDYYKDASTYDTIYDDLYSFIQDDLFYQEQYYLNLCQIFLKYRNSVYNNHLSIGIKHGGHMNELLKKNMKITSISKSNSIIQVCKYNYKENIYIYNPSYESNPYIFDENSFTHISIIDNELYYLTNIESFLYNCYKWLILKGYLFIPFYHNKESLKKDFLKISNNSSVRIYSVYSNEFREHPNDHITLFEKIKDHGKERKNYHNLHFYKKDYIENVANEMNFQTISTVPLSDYESVFIFQKT